MPPDTMPPPPGQQKPSQKEDLEIKDAQLIFDTVWTDLEQELGKENLCFPKEILWLNGAPGAGKGTQTRFMMKLRYLTAAPIVISDLLQEPEFKKLKDQGIMVGDREVFALFIRKLIEPVNASGVVVDGFPRTQVQAELLKLLHNKIHELRREFIGTEHEDRYPSTQFHIIVLYVDEAESVRRQLYRGKKAAIANEAAQADNGQGAEELRKTDTDDEAARNRYRVFKEVTFESLTSLRETFHYHFINAHDSIEEVQKRIAEELKYQSSLELSQPTYDRISVIPLATQIGQHARQELVQRLDGYERNNAPLFRRVCEVIQKKFMPIIQRHALTGQALINSEDVVFNNQLALSILIDVFCERGYNATVDIRQEQIPESLDPVTWRIKTYTKKVYRFSITFPATDIRRGR